MKLKSLLDYRDRVVPMSRTMADLFLNFSMWDMDGPDFDPRSLGPVPLCLEILDKRLEWAGMKEKVSPRVSAFLGFMSLTPGEAVMWAYTLAHMAKELGHRVTMQDLADSFPVGFPDEDGKAACWDAQKGRAMGVKDTDNCMDKFEFWTDERCAGKGGRHG